MLTVHPVLQFRFYKLYRTLLSVALYNQENIWSNHPCASLPALAAFFKLLRHCMALLPLTWQTCLFFTTQRGLSAAKAQAFFQEHRSYKGWEQSIVYKSTLVSWSKWMNSLPSQVRGGHTPPEVFKFEIPFYFIFLTGLPPLMLLVLLLDLLCNWFSFCF